ncbi:uncharacterized protein LOC118558122 [Fundulus heteroclitus]|uniref:uncharacterized protein LOC118558122 n=1 Tax=Fundulus heteroclitus TaxID=8078 RepID=UPI00165BDDF0|nr:uncharacterized protein LOC118558122 [Fundulus heteroclitus]
MEKGFSLEDFVSSPSWTKLEKCRKSDLLMLADHYDVKVSSSDRKSELKGILCEKLVEKGVLQTAAVKEVEDTALGAVGDAALADVPAASSEPSTKSLEGMSSEDLRLTLHIREVENHTKELEVEAMRLRIRALELQNGASAVSPQPPSTGSSVSVPFDISKHITLVPPFRESEVDSYFGAFERIAVALKWPKEFWSLLLQCKLVGKAQEVCSSLSIEHSLDYDILKKTVLQAYELVPEAYRQKFRSLSKTANQTFVEFAREKNVLFDKWCYSCKVKTIDDLKSLILMEEFKKCLPERIVTYLNEQKALSLANAALLADEFILTHKSVFPSQNSVSENVSERQNAFVRSVSRNVPSVASKANNRDCFYCHAPGHLIAACPVLKKKGVKNMKTPAGVGLIKSTSRPNVRCDIQQKPKVDVDPQFLPFISQGFVSLTGEEKDKVPITILRDTGAHHSFLLESVLPLSDQSSCGSDILVWGIKMSVIKAPLHMVHLCSPLVSGRVKVAVRPRLPIEGVSFILGNDLAGGQVFPAPEVVDVPVSLTSVTDSAATLNVFPACAVTRAQARKMGDVIDLSGSFMATLDEDGFDLSDSVKRSKCDAPELIPKDETLSLNITREMLIKAQQNDPSLSSCFSIADNSESKAPVTYFVENGVLMRSWSPDSGDLQRINQVVVPKDYRYQILSLAHDASLAGHLGVKKTYHRVLRNFFWPKLKSDVVNYCRSCHTCQLVGKPNKPISPAPLHPIPVLGEPFERVLLDCVGPLPKTKSGYQYILTIMCAATRFPEAIPLRTLKAKNIVKALITFFSTFGLPKVVQTDQGTNFMSKVFAQVLKEMKIKHQTSSPYHPESQGALERFHQTLKTMLRKYCLESGRSWDEGLPLLLFAVRETIQESLGFSPADLVFGHTVRGPLQLVKEKWLSESFQTEHNVLDYVSSFRDRLFHVCQLAQENLAKAQKKMKARYDKKAVRRSFTPGEKVLVLLPLSGSSLRAQFSGPYEVDRKINETNYVIKTPDRKRKTRVCHINMLKQYISREGVADKSSSVATALVCSSSPPYHLADDNLRENTGCMPMARLRNSEVLGNLESFLSHLSQPAQKDIIDLIDANLLLFSDHPHQTSVLCHDIEVEVEKPIKQHAYRVNPTKRVLIQQEVAYLVEQGLAVPSNSAWSSPCILVPKPDNTARFCTDYRKINAVTKPDSFPLPRMEDCIDRVGSAKFVTKLDLLKGYWQVPLTPRASEISAFVTPDNFLQYTVMPFGLRNAPATFQRLMKQVLFGVKNCEAYLDDVVIYSGTWSEHLDTLSEVFGRFCDASLTLNLSKCEFGKATITYLGKQVGQEQVRPIAAKVQAIIDFPVPQNKRDLRRFLGMCGFYRGFCKKFSDVVSPLTELVSPLKSFVWSSSCQVAFESAKALLCSAPVLAAPSFERPFKLDVDASLCGAGAVLLQEDEEGIEHPVCYFSKKFYKHQVHYSTIEKEALALLLALQHFEVYIGSSAQPVQVFTDHNPLVFISQMRNSNHRLMRWSLLLQDFNLQINYKKGKDNVLADALSRSFN